jgi:hypothetical protein
MCTGNHHVIEEIRREQDKKYAVKDFNKTIKDLAWIILVLSKTHGFSDADKDNLLLSIKQIESKVKKLRKTKAVHDN